MHAQTERGIHAGVANDIVGIHRSTRPVAHELAHQLADGHAWPPPGRSANARFGEILEVERLGLANLGQRELVVGPELAFNR